MKCYKENDMKEGYKTTEFWVTLCGQLAGIAALTVYVTPEDADAMAGSASQIAGGVIMGLSAFGYAYSRGKAKTNVTK